MHNGNIRILIPAGILAFGILFFLIGLAMRLSSRKAARKYTMRVPAVVVAEARERSTDMDGHHMTCWRPTVQFTWRDGSMVTAASRIATDTQHPIGSQVIVLCSPSDPYEFALEDANGTVGTLGAVFLAVGTGVMLLAGVLFVVLPSLI